MLVKKVYRPEGRVHIDDIPVCVSNVNIILGFTFRQRSTSHKYTRGFGIRTEKHTFYSPYVICKLFIVLKEGKILTKEEIIFFSPLSN